MKSAQERQADLVYCQSAMSGGKSSAALQTAYNYRRRGFTIFLIKSATDTKGGDTIVSRNGLHNSVDLLADSNENLYCHVKAYQERNSNLKFVLVDEAQFLSPRQVEQLLHVAVYLGVEVKCYGLTSDFRTDAFAGSIRLFELATKKVSLSDVLDNVCACGHANPTFNARKLNGEFTREGEQIVIDGNAEYESLCAACYLEKVGIADPIAI